IARRLLACLALGWTTAGCSIAPLYLGPSPAQKRPPEQPETSITYELDAGKLNVPLAVARIEGQSVSYDQLPGSLWPERTVGKLHVTYPHADAPEGCARAEVRIDAAPLPDLSQVGKRNSGESTWYRRLPQQR